MPDLGGIVSPDWGIMEATSIGGWKRAVEMEQASYDGEIPKDDWKGRTNGWKPQGV
jgi:hypothetical protein